LIELRDGAWSVAGEPVDDEAVTLREAIEQRRGSATSVEARLPHDVPPVAFDRLLLAAWGAGLTRLRVIDSEGTFELALRSERSSTHALFENADGRLQIAQLSPTELGPGGADQGDELDHAAGWLRARCAVAPCSLDVIRPAQRSQLSAVRAAAQLARAIPDLELSIGRVARVFAGPSGRLEPEDIRRVVREHFQPLRQCYLTGLVTNAKLTGKLIARLVIDREGKVSHVADGGSDIADEEVRTCALKTFYRLRFPRPQGGIVTVNYPVLLAPDQ
jgi:hypothetical protein